MRQTRCLVLLTFNEIEALPKLFDRVPLSAVDEVFVVDGGSSDGTVEYVRSKGLRVLPQDRHGRGRAFQIALEACGSDLLCFYSPDGNEDPADIPRLFAHLEEGGYDLVVASRMSPGARNEEDAHWWRPRKWVNLAFTFLANALWNRGPYLSDTINGFRAIRADAMRRLDLRADGFVIEYLMSMRAMKQGLRLGERPTVESPRLGGTSSAHSWPTGREFLGHLIREAAAGRGVPA
jgi:glycosyltransferase involved in cell wall biosynthesis